MHHGKQGGLSRTRSQEMHTFEEQSWFSPTWKLILWQERLNLPETRTATNHKGASPFPKEGRLKAPANTFQQGKRHITIRPTRTHPCRSGSQNAMKMWKQVRQTCCTNNIGQHLSISVNIHRCVLLFRTMIMTWHAGTMVPLNFSQLLHVLCLATAAPVNWKDAWWPKPTDHNGQYTQSTPGNTFQRSAAGAKLQKMD